MKINQMYPHENSMIEFPVNFFEEIDGYGWSSTVNVWIEYNDSRNVTRIESLKKAKIFVEKMLIAINDELDIIDN